MTDPVQPPPLAPVGAPGPLQALLTRSARWHWLIVLGVCTGIYWVNLGAAGLHSTEGHRAIPGWEALASGRWIPTTMFEALYVRKPPGMPWAIALSSMLLGETELAARAPSALCATLMALAALIAGRRWFGAPWGLAAGLAQALMPRFWSAGRSADIEALNCLAAQVLALVLIDALVARPPGASAGAAARRVALSACAGAALTIMILAKAHAGLPVLGGVLVAACIVTRSGRALASPVLWGALVLTMGLLTPLGLEYVRALQAAPAVSEDFGKFLWDASRLWSWGLMPLAVFASGLPASLALLFPWGPDARREAGPHDDRAFKVARTLALAIVIAIALYMLAGVSNERYAMPVLGLLGPLAAYVARGSVSCFTPTRRAIARLMVLGSPLVLVAAMLAGVVVYVGWLEPRDARSSARPAGPVLGGALPDGAEVWADGFVGAKPELLWYARREAARKGAKVRVLWKHQEVSSAQPPPEGVYLVLNLKELQRYREGPGGERLIEVAQGTADKTAWVLLRASP